MQDLNTSTKALKKKRRMKNKNMNSDMVYLDEKLEGWRRNTEYPTS